jgi:hypothetical protein
VEKKNENILSKLSGYDDKNQDKNNIIDELDVTNNSILEDVQKHNAKVK